eukprot:5500389-Pleurochrysis_carterae.AAC.1
MNAPRNNLGEPGYKTNSCSLTKRQLWRTGMELQTRRQDLGRNGGLRGMERSESRSCKKAADSEPTTLVTSVGGKGNATFE